MASKRIKNRSVYNNSPPPSKRRKKDDSHFSPNLEKDIKWSTYSRIGTDTSEVSMASKDIFTTKDKEEDEGKFIGNLCSVAQVVLANPRHPTEIFIRSCYLQIADILVNELRNRQPGEPLHRLITGTPKIGKSMLLSFLLAQIPLRTTIDTIVIIVQRSSKNPNSEIPPKHFAHVVYYNKLISRMEQCNDATVLAKCYSLKGFTMHDVSALKKFSKRDNVIVFTDGFRCVHPDFPEFGNIIHFASQSLTFERGDTKLETECYFYLPVWNIAEIRLFNQQKRGVLRISPEECIEWFGGAIGHCVYNFKDAKDDVYHKTMIEHMSKFKEEMVALSDDVYHPDACATLVKIVPCKDNIQTAECYWLCEKVKEAIDWNKAHTLAKQKWIEASRATGGAAGEAFEEFLGYRAFLKSRPLPIIVFEDYKKGAGDWSMIGNGVTVFLNYNHPPRVVNWKGNIFPLRFDCIHRLTAYAPSIDFYSIHKAADGTVNIYLIQATTGDSHRANFT